QELNDWGITASLVVDDTLLHEPGYEDLLIIRSEATGGHGRFRYDWGDGFSKYSAKTYNGFSDTTYQVVISDYYANIDGRNEESTLPDSASLRIRITGNPRTTNDFEKNEWGELIKHYDGNSGLKYHIDA